MESVGGIWEADPPGLNWRGWGRGFTVFNNAHFVLRGAHPPADEKSKGMQTEWDAHALIGALGGEQTVRGAQNKHRVELEEMKPLRVCLCWRFLMNKGVYYESDE